MDLIKMFFEEMEGRIKEAKESLKILLSDFNNYSMLEKAFRAIHTVKGSASLVGMRGFQKAFHMLEDILRDWRNDTSLISESSIVNLIDGLDFISSRSDIGEEDLIELKDVLDGKKRISREGYKNLESGEKFVGMLEEIIDNVVELETHMKSGDMELSEMLISMLKKKLIRMYERMKYVRLEKVLEGFEEMVLSDANDLGKKVSFSVDVEGSMIEKEDASVLRDSLVHLVKNAVVHGIETPDERRGSGKNERGMVGIRSFIDGGEIVVEVFDDGRGIDLDQVKEKAIRLGIDFSNPLEVIFHPGFSTKDMTDERAGRGVGLDAVKKFVESREGTISVETSPGRGTKFILRIPLRRYLKRCLILRRGRSIFALKADDVEEVIRVRNVYYKYGKKFVLHEDRLYRVLDFCNGSFRLAVLSKGNAVAVDDIQDVRDVSLKGSDLPIPFITGFALGLGNAPIPVVDPSKFEEKSGEIERERKVLVVDDSPLTRLVVMRILERAGYSVEGVPNVKRAIEIADSEDFDYAIIDLELPDGNGVELLERIKEKNPNIRVAILTTSDTPESRTAAERAGADAFLSKGEDIDKILSFMKGES